MKDSEREVFALPPVGSEILVSYRLNIWREGYRERLKDRYFPNMFNGTCPIISAKSRVCLGSPQQIRHCMCFYSGPFLHMEVEVWGLPLRSWGNMKSKERGGSRHGGSSKGGGSSKMRRFLILFYIKLHFLYCYSAGSWLHKY